MDIGEQQRVIVVEPEPLEFPALEPDPAEAAPEPAPVEEPVPVAP